ncbi:2-dehydro-3-deoxy-D-gluconate 5-dehydrogenase [Planomonospora parontospora subsp. parontospora]|uniref:2-dehydro-3-deoxy-D-gluconate 5-dehydrogenase n=2 Tax=Planomonospora parontospora TaxID=58119 RepID=A0AA37BHR8_9ACTN|nr:SDR family oxidoreductase [Planomonospora parontospora]GGK72556.1 2-dehydro-3-deoxy-D-gluconate 5-dehydrogenase [Planomonospora parontospora]GII09300.1 2-dehydro-3-deoxy-D-gluconate 5-dehydrogenase [Planomonospora parontospora subsp. parontospora]
MAAAEGMFSLAGRTALVTGARTGIGRAVALALAAAGADLVLHGRDDDLDEVEAEVRKTGRQASRWILDLSDPARIPEAAAQLGPVDVLVNNAGIIRRAPAAEHSYADFRGVLGVNLDAVFLLSQAVGAGMLARGSGKIIMIASMLSFQGGVNVPGYTAAKHGVAGLTRALACEWAPKGVQVNAIAPGYIATANTERLRADPVREAEISGRIPAGRWGEPEDLAGAAVFLASRASDYVNGHVLAVDGGWLAR